MKVALENQRQSKNTARAPFDPQWRQDVVRQGQLDEMQWENRTGWKRGDPHWRGHAIDTMDLTIEQVVGRVVAWVGEQTRSSPPHIHIDDPT
jgi:hypothetical protein